MLTNEGEKVLSFESTFVSIRKFGFRQNIIKIILGPLKIILKFKPQPSIQHIIDVKNNIKIITI